MIFRQITHDDLGCGGRLLIVAHHLVSDGLSLNTLIEDLETVCEALTCGRSRRCRNRTESCPEPNQNRPR